MIYIPLFLSVFILCILLMSISKNKGLSGFSSSHVWMWELDYKESWAPKNWCFWNVVLEKTLFFLLLFYFIFKLYIIVLVLPNIKMNPSQVYMCSPSWTLLPPPSPYHPSALGLRCGMWTLSCSTWDLVLWPGIKPRPPALGVQNFSHRTTREISPLLFSMQTKG